MESISTLALGILIAGSSLFAIALALFVTYVLWERRKCWFAHPISQQSTARADKTGRYVEPINMAGFDSVWVDSEDEASHSRPESSHYNVPYPEVEENVEAIDDDTDALNELNKNGQKQEETIEPVFPSSGRPENNPHLYSLATSFDTLKQSKENRKKLSYRIDENGREVQGHADVNDVTRDVSLEGDPSKVSSTSYTAQHVAELENVGGAIYSLAAHEHQDVYSVLMDESTQGRDKGLSTGQATSQQLADFSGADSGDYFVLEKESGDSQFPSENKDIHTITGNEVSRDDIVLKWKEREKERNSDRVSEATTTTSVNDEERDAYREDTNATENNSECQYFVLEATHDDQELDSVSWLEGDTKVISDSVEMRTAFEREESDLEPSYFVLEGEPGGQKDDSCEESRFLQSEHSESGGNYSLTLEESETSNSQCSNLSTNENNVKDHDYHVFDATTGSVLVKNFSVPEMSESEHDDYSTLDRG